MNLPHPQLPRQRHPSLQTVTGPASFSKSKNQLMQKQSDGTSYQDLHHGICVLMIALYRVKEFAPTAEEKWVQEFEDQLSSQRSLSSVAKEMTETVTDPEINATEVSCK